MKMEYSGAIGLLYSILFFKKGSFMRFCYSIAEGHCDRIPDLGKMDQTGFEIRLDTFADTPDPTALRALTARPMLATYRSIPHLGLGSVADRDGRGWELRKACLAAGFELVDLELDEPDLEEKIAFVQQAGGKVVLSHHELKDNLGLDGAFENALKTKADIIKIIGTGRQTRDLVDMRRRYKRAGGRSLVHFYMGAEYNASRVLSLIYGGAFTFLTPEPGMAVAPGQLTFEEISQIYRPHEMDALHLFAVIGSPVGHSRSPAYHNPGLKAVCGNSLFLGLPATNRTDLDLLMECFPEFLGLAVTKPMKEVAFTAAEEFLDSCSARLGAVNTLIFSGGKRKGANTDLLAMLDILKAEEPGLVRILGYGGLGRAVAYACSSLGLKAQVCNRTPGRVFNLPENVEEIPWDDRHSEGPQILVQATSAGMAPKVEVSPLEQFPNSAKTLIETIYNPSETLLMTMARQKGLKVVSGHVLFDGQAHIQHRFFQEALQNALP